VLSRILVFLDKFFLDFRRNGYREVSLPSYVVQSSDYENMRIVRAVKKYYWSGEIRMHYGALNLWIVKKNGGSSRDGLSIVDFDTYVAIDQFLRQWPENVREMMQNLNDLGRYYSFSLTPVICHLYRLALGGCYGDCDGRAVIPFQRPSRLTSDDV